MKRSAPSRAENAEGTVDGAALAAFAARWGFAPDSANLRRALTHKSVAGSVDESNERLEFLGDAILGFVVAEHLLAALPGVPEGTLSRARVQVVRRETLAGAARALGVESLLRVGRSEIKIEARTRDSLLADAYEALIAALFLEHGLAAAKRFIQDTLQATLSDVQATPPDPDPKTRLQIVLQAAGRGLPAYRIVAESGQGHAMHFVAEALAQGEPLGRGEGPSKRVAQTNAASDALKALNPSG